MNDDEFKKLKEEEKAHLRTMRALKGAVRLLERQRSVTSALEEMTTRSRAALEAHERLIEEIALDTAQQEARMDVALESADPVDHSVLEEESAKMRARALVDDMRRQEGPDSESSEPDPSAAPAEAKAPSEAATDPLPEKTLGRMR